MPVVFSVDRGLYTNIGEDMLIKDELLVKFVEVESFRRFRFVA